MNTKRLLFWFPLLAGLLCVFASPYIQNLYLLNVLNLAVISGVLAVSVNLLVGFTGQLSLGHAGFYGIGAYTVALLTTELGWPVWLSFIAAFVLSGLTGLALGLPTIKLKGHFLGIATLGFGIIVNVVINNWIGLTNGPIGVRDIPSPSLFGVSLEYPNYFLAFAAAFLLVIVLLVHFIVNSSVGRAWRCVRKDEITAQVCGINVYGYKLLAFSISGGIAGIAGALYASFMHFVSPEAFDLNQSITIVTTTILGGAGTLFGPLLGTGILTFISEWLRDFQELRLVFYGAILVVMIVFMPQGVYPYLKSTLAKLFRPDKKRREKGVKRDARRAH